MSDHHKLVGNGYVSEYLGDGVYALDDGYHIILRLENHLNETSQIHLDDSVMAALINYKQRRINHYAALKQQKESTNEQKTTDDK